MSCANDPSSMTTQNENNCSSNSSMTKQNENDQMLDSHIFFRCETGNRIVHYLNDSLRQRTQNNRGNNSEDKTYYVAIGADGQTLQGGTTTDNYVIRILNRSIPDGARREQLVAIEKSGVCAFFDIAECNSGHKATNFDNYKSIIDQNFDDIMTGNINVVVDYDGGRMTVPKVWFATSKKEILGVVKK